MRVVIRKSIADYVQRRWGLPTVRKSVRDPKFEYFKRKILEHLTELERKEKVQMRKSLAYLERLEKAQKRNVGEVVTWGRKVKHEYIKGADGKWRRYYRGESRGQKLSVAALRRKVDACKDVGELWDLVFANWGRFMDADKMPLPVVRELHAYASKREDEITAAERKKKEEEEEEDAKLNAMSDKELEAFDKEIGQKAKTFHNYDKKYLELKAKYDSLKDKDPLLAEKIRKQRDDRFNEVYMHFVRKSVKINHILTDRAIKRLRAKRQEMIQKRKSKEVPRSIKGLQDFAFIKNGELKGKELADFAEDYKKITPEFRAILEKYAKNMKVDMHYRPKIKRTDSPAYFDPETNTILLDIQDSKKFGETGFKTNMIVFAHEAGHWLDWNVLGGGKTVQSKLPNLRSLLEKDFLSFVNKIPHWGDGKTRSINNLRGRGNDFGIFLHGDVFETNSALKRDEAHYLKSSISDIVAGLGADVMHFTFNHESRYWNQKDMLETEAVAHFFEAYGTDDEREAGLKEVFPSAYKYFEDFIKTL